MLSWGTVKPTNKERVTLGRSAQNNIAWGGPVISLLKGSWMTLQSHFIGLMVHALPLKMI
jgi:hypothetical protein